ncbi:hypothetical protein Acr_23g0017930 [Actinidia rufa]|uniref:Uncharacterized protein n=1 Tax=Actinidia rufa TaxID=165716 RepID=A0A7J0GRM1_9ERIC|nr:hypothetical protein Acr_23g0017930 [Actinidia rufa]
MQRGVVLPVRKHVAIKRSRGVTAGTSRGFKISNTEEMDARKSSNNYDCLPTPEINKVQEALRTSSLELQAVVKDPLPDALQLADNVISSMGGENMIKEPSVGQGRVNAPDPSVGTSAEAALANESNHDNQCCGPQNNVPKASLMARNSTAIAYEVSACISLKKYGNSESAHLHMHGNSNDALNSNCQSTSPGVPVQGHGLLGRPMTEAPTHGVLGLAPRWDDSIDTVPEGSPNRGRRLHLPTPKRRLVSPFKEACKHELCKEKKSEEVEYH